MNTGLVLSGGGVRGVAHIGAIKALEEHDIYPTHIAGTSAGAVVGALYAGGRNWEEMLDFFKTVELFTLKKYARNKPGFVDTARGRHCNRGCESGEQESDNVVSGFARL